MADLRDTRSRFPAGRWVLLGVFALILLTRLPTLGQPLLERHEWRQTQTAYTALIFSESGIDLLHPQVPVLGPPYELPFEFPLFQAIASVPMTLGVDPDLSLRVVCLATFLASAWLLWGLIRHVAGSKAAFATLVFFAFSPLGIVWSRTSMIEYLATAAALAMVWAGIVWRDRAGGWIWLAAFAAAVVAMLVKPTTGGFYLLLLLAYRTEGEGSRALDFIRARLNVGFIALVVVPVALALVWTRYADGVKAASVLTAPYTSEGLWLWNFGTIAQRLQPSNWLQIARRLGSAILGVAFVPLLLCAIPPAVRSRQWPFWLAMVGVAVLPILVLFNLYLVHDYYLVAISPAWAALLGLGAAWLWDRVTDHRVLAVAGVAAVAVTAVVMAPYVAPIYDAVSDPAEVLPMADELAALSRPDDQVLVLGREWSPSVHYYARRTGFAVPPELLPVTTPAADAPDSPGDWWAPAWVDRAAADAKAGHDYPIMISTEPMKDPIWLVSPWPWMGVLGQRTYVLGETSADLRGATLVATDLPEDTVPVPAGTALLDGPATLRCDPATTLDVPAGAAGTWIQLAAGAPREARLQVTADLAPVLAKRVVVAAIAAAQPGTTLHLSCAGAESLTIEAAVDAAPPSTGP